MSPLWPPKTSSSRPVHTDAYCSRAPSRPLGRRRQVLVLGSYTALPAGPSGEFPTYTTIRRPVHAAAGPPPPRIPDGALAILRHLRVAGLYAAPSDRGAGDPRVGRFTPPQTIISRPVHTVVASRRPGIGALGSARHEGDGFAAWPPGAFTAQPAISAIADTRNTPAVDLRTCQIPILVTSLDSAAVVRRCCDSARPLMTQRMALGYARVAAASIAAKKAITTRKSSHSSPLPPTPTSIWRSPWTS